MQPIDPMRSLQVINDIGPKLAQAKADRIYCEEYAKTLRATLMGQSEQASAAAQERWALAHDDYKAHLEAIREAVKVEEAYRWRMVTAQAAIDVWRSLQATDRAMVKGTA